MTFLLLYLGGALHDGLLRLGASILRILAWGVVIVSVLALLVLLDGCTPPEATAPPKVTAEAKL